MFQYTIEPTIPKSYSVKSDNGVLIASLEMMDDGFYYAFMENTRHGGLPQEFFKFVSDTLIELNAEHIQSIEEYFANEF